MQERGQAQNVTSPKTTFVVPTATGWEVTSLPTVDDSVKYKGYRIVGIPDGLGALPGKHDEHAN